MCASARGSARRTTGSSVPARNHSCRGGSLILPAGSKRMASALTPGGGTGAAFLRPRCSQSITSRQTGAAPETPDTSCIAAPAALPTQTATV